MIWQSKEDEYWGMLKKSAVDILFGLIIGLLAIAALFSAYTNRNRPVVLDADPAMAENAKLPEGHPPIEAPNQIQNLEELSRKDPGNADYRTQVGNAYYDVGQFQKAAEAYQESLRLRPQDPGVETDLGTCYHYIGQSDRALEILDNVLKYSPSFPQALFNKGIVLLDGKKDAKGAIAAWEELLRANPGFPKREEIEQRIRQLKSGG
jgi:tetratricopeptide (TPR) repeat protein